MVGMEVTLTVKVMPYEDEALSSFIIRAVSKDKNIVPLKGAMLVITLSSRQ